MNGRKSLFMLALAVSACGGSSSETPPPLEPLPKHMRKAAPQTTATAAPRRTLTIGIDDPDEVPPAEATWGVEPTPSAPSPLPATRMPDAGLR